MVKDVRQIETIALDHAEDIEAQLRGEILAKANKLFGYTAHAFGAAGPLAKALAALEITPLRSEQVEQYMKRKEGEVRINTNWLFAALGIGVPISLAVFQDYGGWWNGNGWLAGLLIALQVVVSIVGSGFLLAAACEHPFPVYERTTKWVMYALHNYRRYVPLHVLNLAVQVHEAVPNVNVFVHELTTETTKLERPRPDPFMQVVLGAESYWIAVWDEREYEAKA